MQRLSFTFDAAHLNKTQSFLLAGIIGLIYGVAFFTIDFLTANVNEPLAGFGDRLNYSIGLNYYLQDEWRFPFFNIENLSHPEGANIIFTDSIPLIAPLFKLAYQFYPYPYDYFQVWLLFCYILQPIAFLCIVRQFGVCSLLGTLCSALLSLAVPAFLFRSGHVALNSHFLILFALALYFRAYHSPQHKPSHYWLFLTLLICSLLIHAYLFAMVFGVFICSQLQNIISKKSGIAQEAGRVGFSLCIIVALMFASGYLQTSGNPKNLGGYGYYSMNVLSPLWPQLSGLMPFKTPVLNPNGGQYEGFNYWGVGFILALFIALCFRIKTLKQTLCNHPWLALYAFALWILSVSNRVYFGPWFLFEVPNPEFVLELANTFRSSGRFFWLVSYLLLAFSVVVLHRKFTSFKGAYALIAITTLQLLDVQPQFHPNKIKEYPPQQAKHNETWRDLIQAHDRVVLSPGKVHIPPRLIDPYIQLLHFCSLENKPVSSAYLARSFKHETIDEERHQHLGNNVESTLYIFLDSGYLPAEIKTFTSEAQLCFQFQHGFIVCSKQRAQSFLEDLMQQSLFSELSTPTYEKGRVIDFSKESIGFTRHVLFGFDEGISQASWSIVKTPTLAFHMPALPRGPLTLHIRSLALLSERHPDQKVHIQLNDAPLSTIHYSLENNAMQTRKVPIPSAQIPSSGHFLFEFDIEKPVSPKSLGQNKDSRELGFFLEAIKLDHPDAEALQAKVKTYSFGTVLDFSKEGNSHTFQPNTSGLSEPEPQGTWSDADETQIKFNWQRAPTSDLKISGEFASFLSDKNPELTVTVLWNQQLLDTWKLRYPQDKEFKRELSLPLHIATESPTATLRFQYHSARSPQEIGLNDDTRKLALFFKKLSIAQGKPPH